MVGRSPTVTGAVPGTAVLAPPMPRGAPPHALPAGSLAQLAGHGAWLVATPKRRVFPGRPDQVAHARRFVGRVPDRLPGGGRRPAVRVGTGQQRNPAYRTGRSGKFQVAVWRGIASVCVAVLDDGSDTTPAPTPGQAGRLAESGHGLLAVQALAAWWGHHTYP